MEGLDLQMDEEGGGVSELTPMAVYARMYWIHVNFNMQSYKQAAKLEPGGMAVFWDCSTLKYDVDSWRTWAYGVVEREG